MGGVVQWLGLDNVCWLSVDVGGVLIGGGAGGGAGGGGASSGVGSRSSGVGFAKVIALSFGNQTLLQAVDTLQKRLENISLGPSLLGHSIWKGAVS